jgi:hypothetical protein
VVDQVPVVARFAQPVHAWWLSWRALRWGKHSRTCLFSIKEENEIKLFQDFFRNKFKQDKVYHQFVKPEMLNLGRLQRSDAYWT